jgi:3,4-dihydroxy-2-butanone 4-phosphate synthase
VKNCITLAIILVAFSCKGGDKSHRNIDLAVQETSSPATAMGSGAAGGAMEAEAVLRDDATADKADRKRAPKAPEPAKPGRASANTKDQAQNENAEQTVTRSWFPETFLFEPLVVTDDNGAATVPVKVPDRLTTWRVLALGHTRSGAQAGATTSFLGTLPTYIDPVVPPFLIAGDEVRLPIQVVNTTEAPIATTVTVTAKNATVTGAGGTFAIPAQGSIVEYATLRAPQAGTVYLKTVLAGTDAVELSFDVIPAGMPHRITRTGTLAAPRSLTIDAPANAEVETSRVRLLVYPGALALLRAELAGALQRGGVADDAYSLLLAGKAPSLLQALGDKPDVEVLRTQTIVATQRAIRAGRSLTVTSATLLAEAALAHPDNTVLTRLGERAAAYLAQNQRPDGTFSGETGWTLQRVLVATADATRAVAAAKTTAQERQRAMGVGVKAGGAFERNLEHVQDGYTAAAIIASGVGGTMTEKLREKVLAGIKDNPDGTKYLDIPTGVVRADGSVPSRAEATALAVMALAGDPKAPIADLGSTLLGSYDALFGWGDGRANLACLTAVLELFKTPVPDNVKITLTMDGKPITTGTLSGAQLRDVLVLESPAPGLAGSHVWQLSAEPAVPGLGFSLTAHAWTPWPKQTVQNGLELAAPAPSNVTVGKPTLVTVSAIAPAGMPLHIVQSLPAGVQVDKPSLDQLVSAGTLARYQVADGTLDLYVNALSPGQAWSATYRAIPTLGGTLHTAASSIETGTTRFFVPPTTWVIR